jgi:hypothetical protein
MPYSHNLRYYILSVVLFTAILQFFPAPNCFAELKKYRDKKFSFSQLKICSDSDLEQNPEEDSFETAVNEYLGVPYRRGGSGSKGFDCSGLTRKLYLEVYGVDLPHNSAAQCGLNIFDRVPLNLDAFESRDLLFFKSKSKRINHVGIYLEDGKFLHASPGKGVMVSDLNDSYWKKRLVASRRIKDTILSKASGSLDSLSEDSSSGSYTSEIKLGYSADLNETIGLNIETFYSGSLFTPNFFMAQSPRLEKDMLLGNWYGLRAATAFKPAQWLKITPSLGMLDGPSWNNETDGTWHVYGLETAIKPMASQWSIVLSLHSLLNENYFNTDENDTDTDIGLHFNYWVSNSMRFSITGNWEGSYLLKDREIDKLTHDLLSFNMFLTF